VNPFKSRHLPPRGLQAVSISAAEGRAGRHHDEGYLVEAGYIQFLLRLNRKSFRAGSPLRGNAVPSNADPVQSSSKPVSGTRGEALKGYRIPSPWATTLNSNSFVTSLVPNAQVRLVNSRQPL
jgi:hypothetical protein